MARFVKIGRDGELGKRLEDPSLWTEVPVPIVPETMGATARDLRGLTDDQEHCSWLSGMGEQATPLLTAHHT